MTKKKVVKIKKVLELLHPSKKDLHIKMCWDTTNENAQL